MVPRLITIPISHYCEKARWALERAGVTFREDPHLQLIHRLHTRRAGGGDTAPVLVTDGGVLAESSAIVEWADPGLFPDGDARRLVERFDAVLGPDGRRWMYHRLLPYGRLVRAYGMDGVPAWERASVPLGLPLLRVAIRRHLDITEATAATSRARVREVFDEVAERLDGPYLVGDRFTAADLTFAALAAAVLVPEGYGVRLPPVEALPEPFATEVRTLREHPAGAFALRMYAEERR